MKNVFPILVFLLIVLNAVKAQDSLKVLFLGNSYTYGNDLPNMVKQFAESKGKTFLYDQNTPGGYTLNGHSTNATSLSKIAEGDWDFVVLQEQSQMPSFPPNQVASDVYPFASILVDSIRSANACTEPIFFMTWGRENGDQANCEFYEPLCTYEGMQGRLTESYTEMAELNKAYVSPVGEAWRRVRVADSSIDLYTNDGSHPSIYGSYIAASVFYGMMFNDSPIGGSYPNTISEEDAELIQTIAQETIVDENLNWIFSEYVLGGEFTTEMNANNLDYTSTPN